MTSASRLATAGLDGLAIAATSAVVGGLVAVAASSGPQLLAAVVAVSVAVVAVLGGGRRALIGLAVASLPFQYGINFDYDDAAAAVGSLGGVDVSLTTLAVVGLATLSVVDWVMGSERAPVDRGIVRPFAAYVAMVAVASLWAADVALARNELLLLVETLVLLAAIVSWAHDRARQRFVLGCLLLSGGAQAVIAVADRVGVLSIGRVDVAPDGSGARVGGTIGSPNDAGSFFACLVVISLALAASPGRGALERLARWTLPGAIAALTVTSSRGAWSGTALGAVIVLTACIGRGWLDASRVLATAAALLVVGPLVAGPVVNRLTRDDGGSLASRGALAEMTFDVIDEHPLTGVGPNNLGPVLLEHDDAADPRTWVYAVHNKYLLVWAELGIAGLAAFVWFLLAAMSRPLTAAANPDPSVAAAGIGVGAAIVALSVHMLSEPFNSRPQMQTLVVLAALAAAVAATPRSSPEARELVHA